MIATSVHGPRVRTRLSAFGILVAAVTFAAPVRSACTLALVDVNVVSMTSDAVVPGQALRLEGDRIAAIGPSWSVAVDDCQARVDGRGRYLAPGLIDAHVHLESASFAAVFGAKVEPIAFEDVLALLYRALWWPVRCWQARLLFCPLQ
jgi:hypothetical protein